MATDAVKTTIGHRNVTVQSTKTTIWLEVEEADSTGTTTVALTYDEARHIASALNSQATFAEITQHLQAEQMLG